MMMGVLNVAAECHEKFTQFFIRRTLRQRPIQTIFSKQNIFNL